ncbi:PepSY domain-containing protein [Comamonas testosteroni]|uniref:PepSY domain-containing protein n=1 Tax=Comamonas testosteroni TaxID=285 RepID=UPI0023AAF987|nr:PepSY domain-containing protein [Comamonas testosteroni]WEE79039.1 PepSY domain-containing protein [Comamonas testosteroni]
MSRLQAPVFAMSARVLSLYRSVQRRGGIALLGGAALLSAGTCLAAENSLADRASASVAAVRGMALGPTLSIRDVCDRLEKAGYREFQEMEWDDGLYKVKATASDGRFVKLYVDGRSGEVLRVRSKG